MGVLVEKFADDKGIIWPENVAPFKVYLAGIGESAEVAKKAEELYKDLQAEGISVLYDDRDARAGEKFADADLLGIPHRVVISDRLLAENKLEYKPRTVSEAKILTKSELIDKLS
jgi:prolyl-tRNA synthetase